MLKLSCVLNRLFYMKQGLQELHWFAMKESQNKGDGQVGKGNLCKCIMFSISAKGLLFRKLSG